VNKCLITLKLVYFVIVLTHLLNPGTVRTAASRRCGSSSRDQAADMSHETSPADLRDRDVVYLRITGKCINCTTKLLYNKALIIVLSMSHKGFKVSTINFIFHTHELLFLLNCSESLLTQRPHSHFVLVS